MHTATAKESSTIGVENLKTFNKYVLNSYEKINEKKTLPKQEIFFGDNKFIAKLLFSKGLRLLNGI